MALINIHIITKRKTFIPLSFPSTLHCVISLNFITTLYLFVFLFTVLTLHLKLPFLWQKPLSHFWFVAHLKQIRKRSILAKFSWNDDPIASRGMSEISFRPLKFKPTWKKNVYIYIYVEPPSTNRKKKKNEKPEIAPDEAYTPMDVESLNTNQPTEFFFFTLYTQLATSRSNQS